MLANAVLILSSGRLRCDYVSLDVLASTSVGLKDRCSLSWFLGFRFEIVPFSPNPVYEAKELTSYTNMVIEI